MPAEPLTCPHCFVRLRVREKEYIERVILCPECTQPLRIVNTSGGDLIAEAVATENKQAPAQTHHTTPKCLPTTSDTHSHWQRFRAILTRIDWADGFRRGLEVLGNPLVVVWLTAGLFTVAFLFAIFSDRSGSNRPVHQTESLAIGNGPEDPAGLPSVDSPDSPSFREATADNSGSSASIATADPQTVASNTADAPPQTAPAVVESGVANAFVPAVATRPPTRAEKPRIDGSDLEVASRPVIDWDAVLGQPIALFEQEKPVPAEELLFVAEELAGVPIRPTFNTDASNNTPSDKVADGELTQRLTRPITLRLENTTVGEIVQAIVQQVGLELTRGEQSIELSLPKAQ